jgi:hypothetical protein
MVDAASLAGVDAATPRRWRRKGEAAEAISARQRTPEERRFARFCTSLDRASAEVGIQAQQVIVRAIDIDLETATTAELSLACKTAQWFLVHRYPEEYSTRPRQVASANYGGPEITGEQALEMLLYGSADYDAEAFD